jgi:hypothetical protein
MAPMNWTLAIIASLALALVDPIAVQGAENKQAQATANSVTYLTKSGTILTAAEMRDRITMGAPIHMEYVGTGKARRIKRVVLDEN